MNIVIFDLKATRSGRSPNSDEIVAISAIKLKAGNMDEIEKFNTFAQCRPPLPTWVQVADILHAPVLQDALVNFSRFVGDAWLIAERGPSGKMPFIHEACARHHLFTREVRVVDSGDFARKLWPDVCLATLREISERLEISQAKGRLHSNPNLERLAVAVLHMWGRLSRDFEACPVGSCTGLVPAYGEGT